MQITTQKALYDALEAIMKSVAAQAPVYVNGSVCVYLSRDEINAAQLALKAAPELRQSAQ